MSTCRSIGLLTLSAVIFPFLFAAEGTKGGGKNLANFGWFGDLAGACWSGDHPDGKTKDTQCYETQFDRFMRGSVTLVGAHAGVIESNFQGDSVFAWDPNAKRISYWTWANNGGFAPGEAYIDGALIRFPDRLKEGSTAPETRSTWRRLSADSYKVTRERKEGIDWKEMFSVVYRRVPR